MEKVESSHITVGTVKWFCTVASVEDNWAVPQKVKHRGTI